MKFFITKNFRNIFAGSFVFLTIFSAVPALAVTAGYTENPTTNPSFQLVPTDCPTKNGAPQECGWDQLLELMRKVMAFMLFLSATLATLCFAYAGFLYLTAFGEMGKVEKAHAIFGKVMTGFVFIFLGWLIIATILKTLGVEEAFSLVDFKTVTIFSKQ